MFLLTCRMVIYQQSARETGMTGSHGGERHSCLADSSSLGNHHAQTYRACDPDEVKVYQAPPQPRLCLRHHALASSTADMEVDGLVVLDPS